jgi:hypothetical protein
MALELVRQGSVLSGESRLHGINSIANMGRRYKSFCKLGANPCMPCLLTSKMHILFMSIYDDICTSVRRCKAETVLTVHISTSYTEKSEY